MLQAKELLAELQNSSDRIHFVTHVFHKIADTLESRSLLDCLDAKERYVGGWISEFG